MALRWSDKELEILKKYFPLVGVKINSNDLLKALPHRTWAAIIVKASAEGLHTDNSKLIDEEAIKELERLVEI